MVKRISVLTTSPSLNIKNNVSGISNMTNLWVKNNNLANYILFTAGKKDKTNHNIFWLLYQPYILFKFFIKLIIYKVNIVHINMALEYFAIIREFFFICISSIFAKPIILHIHGGSYNLNIKTPKLIRYLIKHSFHKANKIIVLGNNERDFLKMEYHIDNSKILVLPNSVKTPIEYTNNRLNKRLNILFLGRLDKNKGLIEIVKSLKALSSEINFMLQIAGDGTDKEWFLKECELHIPKSYRYHGVIAGSEKEKLLANCHIFLLPSYFEGLPIALLEGMSYGLVPIVTPVGAIPNVILNNENGIIIPLKNYNGITDSINKLMKNPLLYDGLSKNAYKTIQKSFSLDNYLSSLNKLYENLLKK